MGAGRVHGRAGDVDGMGGVGWRRGVLAGSEGGLDKGEVYDDVLINNCSCFPFCFLLLVFFFLKIPNTGASNTKL